MNARLDRELRYKISLRVTYDFSSLIELDSSGLRRYQTTNIKRRKKRKKSTSIYVTIIYFWGLEKPRGQNVNDLWYASGKPELSTTPSTEDPTKDGKLIFHTAILIFTEWRFFLAFSSRYSWFFFFHFYRLPSYSVINFRLLIPEIVAYHDLTPYSKIFVFTNTMTNIHHNSSVR